MKQTLTLIAAPTGMQPGNYVKEAYAAATEAATATVELTTLQSGESWEFHVRWRSLQASNAVTGHTDRFSDAFALIVPAHENANWITMGSADAPIEGVLWRADRSALYRIEAQGMGSVQRNNAPPTWRVQSEWEQGVYTLRWLFPKWENLSRFQRCAVAVWQGAQQQRAGLKSVSAGWVNINA